ncbi:hypothetical protein IKE99_01470 [Candidatus Saccharibacteria bacterium]|nr:hypothetical protein [Candidatus Saccharibacteria bacterium]
MKKTYHLANKTMSGSCRVFPSRSSTLRVFCGSPSKRVTRSWFTTLSALLLSLVVFNSVSALTYQNDTDVDFTINPTISLSISGDLIINNLTLGNSQNSNEITIAVSTNNAYGYNLSATVGNDSEYNTRDLVRNDSSLATKPTISSIDFSSDSGNYLSELTINGDNNGAWGYSIDGGDTYNGLPLYNDDSNVAVLNDSITMPENGTATTSFLIGAIASDSQAAGEYNNVINFYAVTNLAPTTFDEAFAAAGKHLYKGYYKMQDMSSSICNLVEAQGDSRVVSRILCKLSIRSFPHGLPSRA